MKIQELLQKTHNHYIVGYMANADFWCVYETDSIEKAREMIDQHKQIFPQHLYDLVKNNKAEPPVLININSSLYAVGGRTRLYAALASQTDINVIILSAQNLSKSLHNFNEQNQSRQNNPTNP